MLVKSKRYRDQVTRAFWSLNQSRFVKAIYSISVLRIFDLYDGDQDYGGRKPGIVHRKLELTATALVGGPSDIHLSLAR